MASPVRPVVQRSTGIVRSVTRQGLRLTRRVVSDTFGVLQRVRQLGSAPKPMDDTTLARKVETELFRPARAPKGSVDVNVVDGIVELRGEVKRPQQVRELERRARKVPEVRGVENLLHLPKAPSPTRTDTPRRQQRTASSRRGSRSRTSGSAGGGRRRASGTRRSEGSKRASAERSKGVASTGERPSAPSPATAERPPTPSPASGERPPAPSPTPEERPPAPSPVTGERPPAEGEPSPREVAAEGTGRQPGPLGSSGQEDS